VKEKDGNYLGVAVYREEKEKKSLKEDGLVCSSGGEVVDHGETEKGEVETVWDWKRKRTLRGVGVAP